MSLGNTFQAITIHCLTSEFSVLFLFGCGGGQEAEAEGDGETLDLPATGSEPAGPSVASCSQISVLGVGLGL